MILNSVFMLHGGKLSLQLLEEGVDVALSIRKLVILLVDSMLEL